MKLHRILSCLAVLLAASIALAGDARASGGSPLSFGKPDFELTGTVYDTTTKQPIEGAYVVALYYKSIVGPAAMDIWCVKTRGMYTGKDGTFHFPVEKLDGDSPLSVNAIKPGYYSDRPVVPSPEVRKKQGREAYTGRDLPLIPQNPAKPEYRFGSGDVYCNHAETKQDAAAGVEFLKIELSECVRLNADKQSIRAVEGMIRDLESRPEVAPAKPSPRVETVK
ncbi:MAG: hypothetical protein IPP91_12525 [Betaproteobacteria bacterium]|nr:hypothetical protein [Betaproteobacteria bacterium]